MPEVPKPKRKIDWELIASMREKGCVACGKRPSDPAHIRSKGAGGPDESWNLIALCRRHHSQQHQHGWLSLCRNWPSVGRYLFAQGWQLTESPDGRGKMFHPKLAPGDGASHGTESES